jgi:hypothetical protein
MGAHASWPVCSAFLLTLLILVGAGGCVGAAGGRIGRSSILVVGPDEGEEDLVHDPGDDLFRWWPAVQEELLAE